MPLVRITSLDALPAGQVMEATVDGASYAICNVAGQVYAVEGQCPHLEGPLAHGALHDTMLVCPWHAWEFDCRTGASDRSAGPTLASYRVVVEGGDIFLDLP